MSFVKHLFLANKVYQCFTSNSEKHPILKMYYLQNVSEIKVLAHWNESKLCQLVGC
jgi:hypothetical protein